jgi:hypothetical protein
MMAHYDINKAGRIARRLIKLREEVAVHESMLRRCIDNCADERHPDLDLARTALSARPAPETAHA